MTNRPAKKDGMGLLITLKVVPRASRQRIVGDAHGTIKVHLTSPPEDGKANKELIKLIAKHLGYPQCAVELIAGHTSRTKTVSLHGPLSYEEVLSKLGCDQQATFLTR